MKIDIARIPPEGLKVLEDLNTNALDLNRPDLRFTSSLKVNASLIKSVNVVSAEVQVASRVRCACSRCLEESERDFIQHYKFNYEIGKEDKFIDLEPDIKEEIILGYPVKLLCNDDCNGLCSKCGKNLNSGPCSCEK